MPASTTCPNCLNAKDPKDYMEYYCGDCSAAQKEAREFAIREGHDPGTLARAALSARQRGTQVASHPAMGFDRISSEAMNRRMEIEPGSPSDPRVGFGRD